MKVRAGFVSNSSSSSFLVFGGEGIYVIPHMPKMYKDPSTLYVPFTFGGEVDFGRQRENYKDFGSRLNFAWLLAERLQRVRINKAADFHKDFVKNMSDDVRKIYDRDVDEVLMLETVIKDNIPNVTNINWLLTEENYSMNKAKMSGHIDHQSQWFDRTDNYWMIFEDNDSIFHWLFGEGNYVANRSDEYGDADELEVDHRMDYSYDLQDDDGKYVDLYWSRWDNPEKFDEDGNFLGDSTKVQA